MCIIEQNVQRIGSFWGLSSDAVLCTLYIVPVSFGHSAPNTRVGGIGFVESHYGGNKLWSHGM